MQAGSFTTPSILFLIDRACPRGSNRVIAGQNLSRQPEFGEKTLPLVFSPAETLA